MYQRSHACLAEHVTTSTEMGCEAALPKNWPCGSDLKIAEKVCRIWAEMEMLDFAHLTLSNGRWQASGSLQVQDTMPEHCLNWLSRDVLKSSRAAGIRE